ncbi:MAG: glycoside hydrolase family 38 C-terminal domain-containing protein [Aggregatilineales bacterium]
MSEQTTLYVILHTHWDREWYGSFQLFRVRLVRMLNKLIHILETNPEYSTFNLDGQTVILEDYLEVHPERRELLVQLVTNKRLLIGPWYILPDEFLSSGESLVRNLLLGDKMASEFGHRMDVGYIPDTFGHIAQLPQILQGFDLDNCMNMRGLDSGGRKSELWWQSPDGSQVLLHHMSTVIGYSDLGALSQEHQRAAHDLLATAHYKAERATGNVLLAMQGVDHIEARGDLPQIIAIANDNADNITLVQASLEDFWDALKASVTGKDLETVYGELRDVPRTEGSMNFLLYNVLSSRVDNKLKNAQTLVSLENWAEPWAVMAWLMGIADYPQGHLWVAWKWLLKNHPHDSIGGCSVDAVHRQMMTRFEWAQEIADALTEERFRLLAETLDLSTATNEESALVVFNASPWERDEIITVDIDLPEYWLKQRALAHLEQPQSPAPNAHFLDVIAHTTREHWYYGMPNMPSIDFRGIEIRSPDGEAIPVQIHEIQTTTQAIALGSGPRGQMDIRRVRASFRAKIPALGYMTYFVKTDPNPPQWQPARRVGLHTLENDFMRVTVNPNGTFDIRTNSHSYEGLGYFEDSGDNGDGYTFSPPRSNRIYSTLGAQTRIQRIGDDVGVQHIRIDYDFSVPVSLNDKRDERRAQLVSISIRVDLILRDDSPRLEIELTIDNRARDHRLRMRFPTGLQTLTHASSAMQFDVMTRPIEPQPIQHGEWWVEDPPRTFPMHGWMDVSDKNTQADVVGLGVLAEGLYEFGVERVDADHEIALTILRAVGYLGARNDPTTIIGGAGPGIPTPEAQLQTQLHYRMALYPHIGTWSDAQIIRQSQEFHTMPRCVIATVHEGTQPTQSTGLQIESEQVVVNSIKQSEDGTSVIVRLYNPTLQAQSARLTMPKPIQSASIVTLRERNLQALEVQADDSVVVTVPIKKIMTISLKHD